MNRTEILKQYQIDRSGIIRSPGNFEGEMLYAPYFYDMVMHGCGEEIYDDYTDELLYTRVDVDDDARAEFPELYPDTTAVLVYESDEGFVYVEEV